MAREDCFLKQKREHDELARASQDRSALAARLLAAAHSEDTLQNEAEHWLRRMQEKRKLGHEQTCEGENDAMPVLAALSCCARTAAAGLSFGAMRGKEHEVGAHERMEREFASTDNKRSPERCRGPLVVHILR